MSVDRAAAPFAVIAAMAALAAGAWSPWAAGPFLAFLAFTLWFFRDPEREPPGDAAAIVSPADGTIIRADAKRVSIFMNVFDVHVCRAPVAGRVVAVRHHSGRFLAAFRDDASDHNERTSVVLSGAAGDLTFTLVAGLVARRIVCRVAEGRAVAAGDRVGLIRFGSRVDVDLPAGAEPAVRVGERVVGGETTIGRWSGTVPRDREVPS